MTSVTVTAVDNITVSTDSNNFHDIVELIFLDPPQEFSPFLNVNLVHIFFTFWVIGRKQRVLQSHEEDEPI